MIVVDSNVIAYLYLPSEPSSLAVKLREVDPVWMAPRLWRSEMRNTLSLYQHKKFLTFEQVLRIQALSEALLADREFDVPSSQVLRLASESSCSAYDCEFVALAKSLDVKLVTADKQVIRSFPETARALAVAVSSD